MSLFQKRQTGKKAFLTGILGQDGSYLAELLLEKGYQVHGLVRSSCQDQIKALFPEKEEKLFFHEGDLLDSSAIRRCIEHIQPDEVYHLAAPSHIHDFERDPEGAADVCVMGSLRLLEAIRLSSPQARFYQATSSELFGVPEETPQKETTPFLPRSLYGIAKQHAFWTAHYYRQVYGLFACNGILYNHESPRRKETFVSRKIVRAVAAIAEGKQEKLLLGNLNAQRDWGYAKDFVEGMWRMLQQEEPEDFVLATGRLSSVRQFVELAFEAAGMEIVWKGVGIEEIGVEVATNREVVALSSQFFRPDQEFLLVGDPSKAKNKMGWVAQTSLEKLVQIMMHAERMNQREAASIRGQ